MRGHSSAAQKSGSAEGLVFVGCHNDLVKSETWEKGARNGQHRTFEREPEMHFSC